MSRTMYGTHSAPNGRTAPMIAAIVLNARTFFHAIVRIVRTVRTVRTVSSVSSMRLG